MSRPTRNANTQTPADRALWRKIRRQMSAARRRKRKFYCLSSNREADLYIPRHFPRSVTSFRFCRRPATKPTKVHRVIRRETTRKEA